ncbi:MAG: hypothetical protein AAF479_16305 [Pseudomonadota bacterium]
MADQNDIIASAPTDAPEVLDIETLDALSAGAYGGSNSCDPYSGDNSCEDPGAGHASIQDLQIRKPRTKSTTSRRFSAG